MVGALDPTPSGSGAAGSVYHEVGYAGLVWHTYDLGCGPSGMRNPDAVIDTWTGNLLFNVGKVIVGASNGLHYALAEQGLLTPLLYTEVFDEVLVEEQLGRELVCAQAYTKEEIAAGADDPNSGVAERKKQEYEAIAARTGSAYGYFQGIDGSRIGVGFLAALQSVMFALFQLLAQAALLLAQIVLRVVILLGPVIGLVAVLYHELLRRVDRGLTHRLCSLKLPTPTWLALKGACPRWQGALP